ncbi:MAG: hypothetical protein ABSA17_08375 [Rhabdochlamydiaceae bacterium]
MGIGQLLCPSDERGRKVDAGCFAAKEMREEEDSPPSTAAQINKMIGRF